MTKNDNKMKWIGEIRNSQLVTTYGCGALCDFPGVSGIVSSIHNWEINAAKKIREPNLETLLEKNYFIQMIDDSDNKDFYIPVYRFPEWYYCPGCEVKDENGNILKVNNLGPYSDLAKNKDEKMLKCEYCNTKLNPSRFIVACANGHIDDFPYWWWVHKNYLDKIKDKKEKQKKEEEFKKHKLQIIFDDKKEGLDGIIIRCITCGAKRSMQGCLGKDALKGYKCHGKRPWIKFFEKTWIDNQKCEAIPRTLLRSGNNVYYPITESAITLPDATSVEKAIDWFNDEKTKRKEFINEYISNNKTIEEYCEKIEEDKMFTGGLPCEKEIIIETYNRFFSSEKKDADEQRRNLIKAEYNALCQENASDKDKNFKLLEVDIPKKYQKYFSKVRLVKKLREIQVLKGFNRILPEFDKNDQNIKDSFGTIKNEYMEIDVPHKDYKEEWLPAVELIGEGIFIELNPKKLQEWVTLATEEKSNYKKMRENLMSDPMGSKLKEKFSEQYVLLHTLSHLLIRQLAYDCGYNTASIKEKIYTTFNVKNKDTGVYEPEGPEMAGILIYTASTDSDGSLGGLVRQGETDNFERLLDNTLENAYWCSNDPVCSESKGQGYRSLNYAACHACTLLPETSCEAFNSLLDRASVIGIPGNEEYENFGFFDLDELKNE